MFDAGLGAERIEAVLVGRPLALGVEAIGEGLVVVGEHEARDEGGFGTHAFEKGPGGAQRLGVELPLPLCLPNTPTLIA